uniref:Zf-Tim10_DDP domain-containing protein n=1 Tax=Rhabditophanes sp. KR3021 TaxID=114890 RepID=A0AC35U029_9BILA
MSNFQLENISQLREFLTVYNALTNRCFSACVYDLNSNTLIPEETKCAYQCLNKQMSLNQNLMIKFQEQFKANMLRKQAEITVTENTPLPANDISPDPSAS